MFVLLRNPVFIFALIMVGVLIFYYNRLIKMRIKLDEALSGVDVQLRRRRNLIPPLRRLLESHTIHEKEILTLMGNIQALTPMPLNQNDLPHRASQETALGNQLHELLRLMGKDSSFQAREQFLELSENLEKIEDELQMARRYYNAVVRDYNIMCETFPSGILAGMLNLETGAFFVADEHYASEEE